MTLAPITVRPVERPAYDNFRIHDFSVWYAQNESRLLAYFNALGQFEPDAGAPEDYFGFCACQYDLELGRLARALAAHSPHNRPAGQ